MILPKSAIALGHGVDMMTAGQRAWNTATPPQTRTERCGPRRSPEGACAPRCCQSGRCGCGRPDPGRPTACSRVFRSHSGHSRGFSGRKPTNLPACRYRPGALPPAFAVSSTDKNAYQPEPSLTPSTETARSQTP